MKYIVFVLLVLLTLCLCSTALAEASLPKAVPAASAWKWWTIAVCGGGVLALMCLWSYQALHPGKRKRRRGRRKSGGQT